jgi:DNA-directed RNA polymerase specialized sigma24 family protein
MGKPRGNRTQQLLDEAKSIVEAIAESKKRSMSFAYFTGEDIAQEVWVICLKALERYNATKGPLENYLRRCVENRLKNLKRDRYFRPPAGNPDRHGKVRDRINIVNALPLGGGDVGEGGSAVGMSLDQHEPHAILGAEELRQQIESRLPPDLRADFRALLDGDYDLTKSRRERVRKAVAVILEQING